MSGSNTHTNPLLREGTTQAQRLLEALIPENVKIHELSTEDWLHFARDFATQLNYYKLDKIDIPNGDWEDFFVAKDEIQNFLTTIDTGNTEPHISLFIAFLQLLSHPQNSLNQIPKRHLDFYYKEVLRTEPKSFTPDTVHLIFQLAKNTLSELVESKSGLEAGKDSLGQVMHYELDDEIVVNTAQIQSIKSFQKDANVLKYIAEPQLIEDQESWSAFGDEAWSESNVEILLSSDILRLNEGERVIKLNWTVNEAFKFEGKVYAQLTTEAGWTDPINITEFGDVSKTTWEFTLNEDVDPISPFISEVHELNLETEKPILKIYFDKTTDYGLLKDLIIKDINIEVEVFGVTQIELENVAGQILPDKPFMPFGSRPNINAALKINVPEFDKKYITNFQVNMPWMNMPADFNTHYDAYKTEIDAQKTSLKTNVGLYFGHYPGYILDSFFNFTSGDGGGDEITINREDFKINVSSAYNGTSDSISMFSTGQPIIDIDTDPNNEIYKSSEISVQLLSSFYHDLYNAIYVSVITSAGATNSAVDASALPKEPYTPMLDGLTMNYKASASLLGIDSNQANSVQLFQSTPFGTKQTSPDQPLIFSVLNHQLYLGLRDVDVKDVVSILFQIAEGTENPDESNFGPDESIGWYVLTTDDIWEPLDDDAIVSNNTNNFLQSGIVKLTIPDKAVKSHSFLDDGLVWIKCELKKKPESVSQFISIHTQAVRATFVDQGNALDQLSLGLSPSSISQLAKRKSKIKKVEQPYASFGGVSIESDPDFYRRISERLRHKDRALNIWDFEHMILQAFPQLYKVKCLNHTKIISGKVHEIYPGSVSIAVIPQIKDLGSDYKLQPKVSQNTKDLIKAYLIPKSGLHIELDVVNPIYEDVKFEFKIKFLKGLDFNYYQNQVQDDLKSFVAPWIKDESASDISFGRTLYSFEVINFLENLSYVDYIEDFFMRHKILEQPWEIKELIEPSSALAVLVPSDSHNILEAQAC